MKPFPLWYACANSVPVSWNRLANFVRTDWGSMVRLSGMAFLRPMTQVRSRQLWSELPSHPQPLRATCKVRGPEGSGQHAWFRASRCKLSQILRGRGMLPGAAAILVLCMGLVRLLWYQILLPQEAIMFREDSPFGAPIWG